MRGNRRRTVQRGRKLLNNKTANKFSVYMMDFKNCYSCWWRRTTKKRNTWLSEICPSKWTNWMARKWIDKKYKANKAANRIWRWEHNLIIFQRKTSKLVFLPSYLRVNSTTKSFRVCVELEGDLKKGSNSNAIASINQMVKANKSCFSCVLAKNRT